MSKGERTVMVENDTPGAPKVPSRPDPIPVRRLFLQRGVGLEFPGCPGRNECTSVPDDFGTPRAHWRIDFLPWIRQHRVVWHQAGGRGTETRMYPESLVAWEPMS